MILWIFLISSIFDSVVTIPNKTEISEGRSLKVIKSGGQFRLYKFINKMLSSVNIKKYYVCPDWIQKILLCDTLVNKDNETVKSHLYQDQCLKRVDKVANWTVASTFCKEKYQVLKSLDK